MGVCTCTGVNEKWDNIVFFTNNTLLLPRVSWAGSFLEKMNVSILVAKSRLLFYG